MEYWKPDRLLRVLLFWTALTFLVAWLPTLRGLFDGPSYQWGAILWGWSFRGAGVGGDYWFPVLQSALGLTILWLGWRGARPPFGWLFAGWHATLFSSALYGALVYPDRYRFRGDTLGIDVSLAAVGPILTGGFLALAVLWLVRDLLAGRARERRPVPPWAPANTVWAAALAALLPVQFVLLRFGVPHGVTDAAGVLITIAGWLLIGVAIRPRPPRVGPVPAAA